jgi:multidrug efflux pump subunit AcrA (membrane-fusion protein)
MKILGWAAVAALVVAGALAGRAWSSGTGAEAAPGRPTAPSAPAQPSRATPSGDAVPPVGLNVRYLDSDGKVKRLDVRDFPR